MTAAVLIVPAYAYFSPEEPHARHKVVLRDYEYVEWTHPFTGYLILCKNEQMRHAQVMPPTGVSVWQSKWVHIKTAPTTRLDVVSPCQRCNRKTRGNLSLCSVFFLDTFPIRWTQQKKRGGGGGKPGLYCLRFVWCHDSKQHTRVTDGKSIRSNWRTPVLHCLKNTKSLNIFP